MRKKIFIWALMIFVMMCSSAWADVLIDEEHFHDDTFRTYVISKFDKDHDGVLNNSEIEQAKVIDLYDKSRRYRTWYVKSLKGIEYLTALESLSCGRYNGLTEIDVSKNTALKYLSCSENRITSLNLNNNRALETLYCENNLLTSLNVSSTSLKYLYCSHTGIS